MPGLLADASDKSTADDAGIGSQADLHGVRVRRDEPVGNAVEVNNVLVAFASVYRKGYDAGKFHRYKQGEEREREGE